MKLRMTVAALAICAMASGPALAADDALTPAQEQAIEKLVERYILDHPEVLVRAVEGLQAKRRAEENAAVAKVIKARYAELTKDPTSGTGGAADGDVVVVEFFDYHCGVCKRVLPVVLKLMEGDPKIKFVYKEWPILGPESVVAARAALASKKQGKYFDFHNVMMKAQGKLDEPRIMSMAKSVGLDTAQLLRDMKDPEIDETLKRNFDLADAMRLTGTPSFLVGETLLRGGRNLETMQALVKAARKGRKDGS